MPTYTVQYLEPNPETVALAPQVVGDRLQATFERLPISHVLLGWDLPAPLVQVCREVTEQAGAKLFLWHPLLTANDAAADPDWFTRGPGGEPVPGFQNMPEFTFLCPNNPAVRGMILQRLKRSLAGGLYDGVFLDRIRYPSPAVDPGRRLACFCEHCHRAAAASGLDLTAVQHALARLLASPQRIEVFIRGLLSSQENVDTDDALLNVFLDFRAASVQNIVREAAEIAYAMGLEVGLDCFTPALTRMVGQDLAQLNPCSDWIKVMTYLHTIGPAGLPFELLDLAQWLIEKKSVPEDQALTWLATATQLPLPATREALREQGLPSAALAIEVNRARAAGVHPLWMGIELVEIPGVSHLDPTRLEHDLATLRTTDVDGLVLSWDLWHIPLERLEQVKASQNCLT
ncbi:MAG: hypothetical protein JXR84_16385 [Anaerolineae bacterium]|nr:hypothetical protein [Anaerolineae bacterium]